MRFFLSTALLSIALFLSGCFHLPQTPPLPPPNDTPPTPTTTAEIDTADWETYTNEEYGFGFRYPREWVLVTKGLPKDIIRVQRIGKLQTQDTEFLDGAMLTLIIKDMMDNTELIKRYISKSHRIETGVFNKLPATFSEGKTSFGNILVAKSHEKNIIVSNDSHSFIISALSVGDEFEVYKNELSTILSTINFIN